jgi:hypothetical protein
MWIVLACSPEPELSGDCQLAADNTLRASCTFEADPPAPVTLTLTPEGGGDEIVRTSSGEQAERELALWRMRPETRYRWLASAGEVELTGELETGAVPLPALVTTEQTGAPPSGDTMFVLDCEQPVATVLDPEGQVVWYQELAAGLPAREDGRDHNSISLSFTEEGTALAIVDERLVREFAMDGRLLQEIPYGDDTTYVMHHDVFRRNGRTFAVTARLQDVGDAQYIVDGVVAFESDGTLLYEWDVSQLAEPSGPGALGGVYWGDRWPGALAWAHLNGLYVDTDGDLIVSLHGFSTVLRVEGDPDDPAFGTPVWSLAPPETGPLEPDLVLTDPEGRTDDEIFGHQHHPHLLPDGTLQIFDNGEAVTDEARVLQLGLDLEAREAPVRGSFPLGTVCPIEGGAFVREGGQLVATCALRGTYYELAVEDGAVLGETRVTCASSSGFTVIPRAIPVKITP